MSSTKRQSILSIFFKGLISIIVLLSTFHCFELYYLRDQRFTKEISDLKNTQLAKQKDEIQREVDSAIENVRFQSGQKRKQARRRLQNRVMEAYAIASQLHSKYEGKKTKQEIQEIICESLRNIRFNHGRGYFFILKLDGTIVLLPICSEREGQNLLFASHREAHLAERLIEIAKKNGEGFYNYTWQKPDKGEKLFPKMSYIKRVAPEDWLIGTGEYRDDLELEIKTAAIEQLGAVRFGEEGFIFAVDYNSKMLTHADPGLIGNRMLDSAHPQIREAFPQMLALTEKNGAYVEYSYYRLQVGKVSRKISYIDRMPEWQFMIGAGFFLDSIEAAIANQQKQLRRDLLSDVLHIAVLFLVSIALATAIVKLFSRKLQNDINLFNEFFYIAASQSTTIEKEDVTFREFDQLAGAINQMVKDRERIEADRKQLEAQLMQKKKIEAIGTLAGGIAHDFNNLLTVMFGNISLLSMKVDHNSELYKYILRLQQSADKAKDLVTQILSFSRCKETHKQLLDLNQTVRESLNLLRSTIPTTVNLDIDLPLQRYPVMLDKTQLHQVVMNLCSNACQALPEQTGNIKVSLKPLSALEAPAIFSRMNTEQEKIAHLQIADSGMGIPPEILDQIFDPFFSTKSKGKGTGLGLSIAHRIIEQSQGLLEVDSVFGQGSTFHIYLPLVDAVENDFAEKDRIQIVKGTGTVLLVDDDPAILESTAECLAQLGYSIIKVSSAVQALDYCIGTQAHELSAVITDQTMPGMTGLEFIDEVRTFLPHLPIILCTGFSEQVSQQIIQKKNIGFLMKPPYLPELSQLLKKYTSGL